jgi:hypothetical protein
MNKSLKKQEARKGLPNKKVFLFCVFLDSPSKNTGKNEKL